MLEVVAKYDPFLAEHMDKYGNRGQGNVSYLSSTICDEFIEIIGNYLHENIVQDIKKFKYYGIIVESTPDLQHVDQLHSSCGILILNIDTLIPVE